LTGGWVGLGADLDEWIKTPPTGVRNLNSPACSDLLYHLRHLGGQWFLYCDWSRHNIYAMINSATVDSYQNYRFTFKLAHSIFVELEIIFHWCIMLYCVHT